MEEDSLSTVVDPPPSFEDRSSMDDFVRETDLFDIWILWIVD